MVVQIIWLLILGCSPREAACHVFVHRGLEGGASESSKGLERIWWFRLLAFVLSALPQVIKLYGMTGILWTQSWASMYLVTFLVFEIITQLAGIDWTESQLNFNDQVLHASYKFEMLKVILMFVSCTAQIAIWAIICALFIPTDVLYTTTVKEQHYIWEMELLYLLAALIVYAIPMFVVALINIIWAIIWFFIILGPVWIIGKAIFDLGQKYVSRKIEFISAVIAFNYKATLLLISTIVSLAAACGYFYMCGSFFFSFFPMNWPIIVGLNPLEPGPLANLSMKFVLGLCLLGCICLISFMVHRVMFVGSISSPFKRTFELSRTMEGYFALHFFLFTLLTALLYYCFCYNLEGTFKPGWTDVLG